MMLSLNVMTEKMVEMALAMGADDAEAIARFTDSSRIEVKEGKVEGTRRTRETSAAIRVLVNGRPGFSFATDPGDDAINGMIRDAVQGAKLVPAGEENRFSVSDKPGACVGILDHEGIQEPLEKKIDMARDVESAALAADERIRKTHKPSYGEQYRTTAISSGGCVWNYEDTYYSIGVEAIAEGESGSQTGYDFQMSRTASDLEPRKVGERAALEAAGLLGGQPPVTGKYPALLPPKVAVSLLGVLASSFSADEMQKGRSRLAGKMGEKIFSDLITLIDNGSLPGGVGTVPFDDERVPPVPRRIVEKGSVFGAFHTLKTAAKEGVLPTGNGFRGSLAGTPTPGSTNLILEAGQNPVGDLLPAGTTVSIENLMGVHTIDRVSGDFSLGASGYMVVDGERADPFRNGTVSGNLFDLFSTILAVGNDLKFYGSTGSPSILVAPIIVSGR
ncbi:TldD/PmbA family protein [bacterium]|nr:MAG: TldD/PmbA family protein [bacterium]